MLDLIYINIYEMTNTLSNRGKRYFITFIDDASKYTYVFFLKIKAEVFETFKTYNAEIDNLLYLKIRILR